ncbi:hypothetical protein KIW84_062277 [Lathyrus oleraceus]|uniref:TF-B3 domain-containing protein n=1 Tax=Pisum sativum TaxID=3888 RepID=A0A9D4W4U9_PEA|nr:hypothetical protein KIW84_062277 [Pisum sativum]
MDPKRFKVVSQCSPYDDQESQIEDIKISFTVMKSSNDLDNMQNDMYGSEMDVVVEDFEAQSVDVDCENDDIEFVWEREITSLVKARHNVLNIPRKVAEGCVTMSRGKGWYEFAKDKELRKGDVLGFMFDSSEGFLYVEKKKNDGFQGSFIPV